MCPDSFNFGAVYMFACLRVHVHNILFVSIVRFFKLVISKLCTSGCTNCLYLYEPVMLSTAPCLH